MLICRCVARRRGSHHRAVWEESRDARALQKGITDTRTYTQLPFPVNLVCVHALRCLCAVCVSGGARPDSDHEKSGRLRLFSGARRVGSQWPLPAGQSGLCSCFARLPHSIIIAVYKSLTQKHTHTRTLIFSLLTFNFVLPPSSGSHLEVAEDSRPQQRDSQWHDERPASSGQLSYKTTVFTLTLTPKSLDEVFFFHLFYSLTLNQLELSESRFPICKCVFFT